MEQFAEPAASLSGAMGQEAFEDVAVGGHATGGEQRRHRRGAGDRHDGPGLIKTKFSQALWNDEAILERFMRNIPLKRIGTADDIAGLAVFLASDAAAYSPV